MGGMANAMDCETLAIKRDFLSATDERREELRAELELNLDLSLGGYIGKAAKENKKEDPCLKKYASGNLQPCLKKFKSGSWEKDGEESRDRSSTGIDTRKLAMQEIWTNLHNNKPSSACSTPAPLSRSFSGAITFEEVRPLVVQNGPSVKTAWPHQFTNTSTPMMVQNGTEHPRILRTCSVGTVRTGLMAPQQASVLHKQPSLEVLLPDRKEGAQSTMQKEILEQQRKRQVHAMRRQEARKKREEKQQKKARRDEGKSYTENKVAVPFHITSNATPPRMLNPEPSSMTQTSQTQMDPKEEKSNPLLETQRSLQRYRDRAVKENEPRIEKEKRVKKKGGGNGSMDPLPCDFEMGNKLGVADPVDNGKFVDRKANGNHSASTRNSNSPIRGGNSGSEDKTSKEVCENDHKSSSCSNAEEGESASSRSHHSTNCEASGPYSAPAYPMLPIPYPYPFTGANPQCMPLPIGFSFPYVMPFWTPATQPTGFESSKCNFQQHGLLPFQIPIPGIHPNWLSVTQEGAPAPVPGPVQNSHASGGSLHRSSSTSPDQDSKSSEGTSSNETKSQSRQSPESFQKGFQSLARVPSINKAQGQVLSSEISASIKLEPAHCREAVVKTPCTAAQADFEISKTSQEKPIEAPCKISSHILSDSNEEKPNSSSHGMHDSDGQTKQTTKKSMNESLDQDTNSNLKPGMSCSQSSGADGLLPALHWVTTTGIGPNGITISGILSSYSSNQVRIVCVCHGTQMSPAEFVQHAGSTDISNPERNIVVTPIPVGIPATSAQG